MNEDGLGETRLTFNTTLDKLPCWSADGMKIAFIQETHPGPPGCWYSVYQVFSMNFDGTGAAQLTDPGTGDCPEWSDFPSWSPDGSTIALSRALIASSSVEIHKMPAGGGVDPVRLTESSPGVYNVLPRWSPDGKKLAFVRWSMSGEIPQIWVMNADGSNQKKITDIRSPGVGFFDWADVAVLTFPEGP